MNELKVTIPAQRTWLLALQLYRRMWEHSRSFYRYIGDLE